MRARGPKPARRRAVTVCPPHTTCCSRTRIFPEPKRLNRGRKNSRDRSVGPTPTTSNTDMPVSVGRARRRWGGRAGQGKTTRGPISGEGLLTGDIIRPGTPRSRLAPGSCFEIIVTRASQMEVKNMSRTLFDPCAARVDRCGHAVDRSAIVRPDLSNADPKQFSGQGRPPPSNGNGRINADLRAPDTRHRSIDASNFQQARDCLALRPQLRPLSRVKLEGLTHDQGRAVYDRRRGGRSSRSIRRPAKPSGHTASAKARGPGAPVVGRGTHRPTAR